MALFTGSIRSAALQMDTLLQVFMPAEDSLAPAGTEMKTVILLHGLNECYLWGEIRHTAHANL